MNRSINDVFGKIKWLIVPYLLILCICFVIKLAFSRETIYFTVNGMNSPIVDFLAPFFTDLGNGWTAVAISLILLLFSYRKALIMAVVFSVTSITAQIIKFIFLAPRPKLYFKDQLSRIHFVKGIDILNLYSFPSGHTVTAISMAVVFTYWSKNKAWGPVFLLVACMVGYSRMYLSEHFFEDVMAGYVLGMVLTVILLSWMDTRAFIQKPKWQRGLLRQAH